MLTLNNHHHVIIIQSVHLAYPMVLTSRHGTPFSHRVEYLFSQHNNLTIHLDYSPFDDPSLNHRPCFITTITNTEFEWKFI